ncbi:LANO_0H02388g1_1 [Lachancea nothofagi CBS 11611]|uniref:LANO_0H02388g1_1 n=1 Tax=Lachancea nothofagi CBS 11611 TaxID=1266666 RepID=A0A1G4KLB5_9SACH|nr:LANO_0H02388g1_1 [Lachancea nothofagi CBS 11611]
MNVNFDSVYLANTRRNLLSQWSSSVTLLNADLERSLDLDSIVLPPRQKSLQININLNYGDEDDLSSSQFTHEIIQSLTNCSDFWHDLNYKPSFQASSASCVEISLDCEIFTTMKTKSLLEQPLSILKHMNARLLTVTTVDVQAVFLGTSKSAPDIVKQCNEFLVSLFVSQLEFQFPLAFSRVCRSRFLQQEAFLGPISYALANSASMIPKLIKIISDDKTATTCYRILQLSGDRRKVSRLLKLKDAVSPFQILKHS